jgi:hypothetical protein
MAKVENVVKDPIILELLDSFLNSSLLTKNGHWKNEVGILPSGTNLTSLLFHFLMDEFDRAFKACFPEVKYVRYYDEIRISFDQNKYDLKYFDDLFEEHELKI